MYPRAASFAIASNSASAGAALAFSPEMSTGTHPSRAVVLEIVREAAAKLHETQEGDAAAAVALRDACVSAGVEPTAFDAAIAADPELELLEQNAIREALLGSTDPGPYGGISRESMTGQPGDTTKHADQSLREKV